MSVPRKKTEKTGSFLEKPKPSPKTVSVARSRSSSKHGELRLAVGDRIVVTMENSQVVLKRKSAIADELDTAVQEIEDGKYIGPFDTAEEAMKALRGKPRK